MSDLKLLDNVICNVVFKTGWSFAEMENLTSNTAEAFRRLRDAHENGDEQLTIALTEYLKGG